MTVWYILLIVSLAINVYCVVNIVLSAQWAESTMKLIKLRFKQVDLMQKEIDCLKSYIASKENTYVEGELKSDD